MSDRGGKSQPPQPAVSEGGGGGEGGASFCGFDPSRTDIQVWPMGHGMVATGVGEGELAGCLLMAALPDNLVTDNWENATAPSWNEIAEAGERGGQVGLIQFADRASLDRFIATLKRVRATLPRKPRARA